MVIAIISTTELYIGHNLFGCSIIAMYTKMPKAWIASNTTLPAAWDSGPDKFINDDYGDVCFSAIGVCQHVIYVTRNWLSSLASVSLIDP